MVPSAIRTCNAASAYTHASIRIEMLMLTCDGRLEPVAFSICHFTSHLSWNPVGGSVIYLSDNYNTHHTHGIMAQHRHQE